MIVVQKFGQSSKLFVGSKASVKIYEFDEVYGHIASYKIILN